MSDLSAASAAAAGEPGAIAEGTSGSNRSLWGDVRCELVRSPCSGSRPCWCSSCS